MKILLPSPAFLALQLHTNGILQSKYLFPYLEFLPSDANHIPSFRA